MAAADRRPAVPAVARAGARGGRAAARARAVGGADPRDRGTLGARARRGLWGPRRAGRAARGRRAARPVDVPGRLPLPECARAARQTRSGPRPPRARGPGARGRVRALGPGPLEAPHRHLFVGAGQLLRVLRVQRAPFGRRRRAQDPPQLRRRAPARQALGGVGPRPAPRRRRDRAGIADVQCPHGGHGVRLRRRFRVEGHVLRPHAERVEEFGRRRHVAERLPLPPAPGPRRRAPGVEGRRGGVEQPPRGRSRPAGPEPLPGRGRALRRDAAAVADPGAAGHGQDRDVRGDRLALGEAGHGAGPRDGAVEHRRGPAHGEDPRDGPQGRAPLRQVPRGHLDVRRPFDAAHDAARHRHAGDRGAAEAHAAQGGPGRARAGGREAVPQAAGEHGARAVEGRGRHLHDVRVRGRPAIGRLAVPPGAHRRGDAGDGARESHPHRPRREAARARRRPPAARARDHVQGRGQGRPHAVPL
mmetsp:Transcript_19415/g.62909  ORF Transcript_19415/g.62909 Transcript_19415/m.62909 type:complete len:474 (-) Transcript_19415:14-1435(-)